MTDRKAIKMLSIDDPEFMEKLGAAIGLAPGEKAEFVTPQFTRTDGLIVSYIPRTAAEYELLKMLRPDNLKRIGCQAWDGDRLKTHWLFPSEWYSSIPDGLLVTDIFGQVAPFIAGETDDDTRYGALSFGFIQEHEPRDTP